MNANEIFQKAKERLAEVEAEAAKLRGLLGEKSASPSQVNDEWYVPLVEHLVGGHRGMVEIYANDPTSGVHNQAAVLFDINMAREITRSHLLGCKFVSREDFLEAALLGRTATALFAAALAHMRNPESLRMHGGNIESQPCYRLADGLMQRVRSAADRP